MYTSNKIHSIATTLIFTAFAMLVLGLTPIVPPVTYLIGLDGLDNTVAARGRGGGGMARGSGGFSRGGMMSRSSPRLSSASMGSVRQARSMGGGFDNRRSAGSREFTTGRQIERPAS